MKSSKLINENKTDMHNTSKEYKNYLSQKNSKIRNSKSKQTPIWPGLKELGTLKFFTKHVFFL